MHSAISPAVRNKDLVQDLHHTAALIAIALSDDNKCEALRYMQLWTICYPTSNLFTLHVSLLQHPDQTQVFG